VHGVDPDFLIAPPPPGSSDPLEVAADLQRREKARLDEPISHLHNKVD